MPGAPLVAMSQGSTPAAFSLFLTMSGVEYIPFLGSGSPGVGVPADTVEIFEAGPGGVSSLRFMIEDPGTSAPLPADGAPVYLHDRTNNVPLFRGTVNSWQAIPRGVGRAIVVECDGPETALENIVPSASWTFTGSSFELYHHIIANLGQYARLNNIASGGSTDGSLAFPIGTLFSAQPPPGATLAIEGSTVRQAILEANKVMQVASGSVLVPNPEPNIHVDMYGGLRAWRVGQQPDDYTTLTITNTAAGVRSSVAINYEVHPADVVREVYVKGANATASDWFSDGSGIQGRQAYLTDTSLTTWEAAYNAAQTYLNGQAARVRGSFRLDAWNPTITIHAGSLVSITDASLGMTAQTFIIQSIRKVIRGKTTLQDWEVHFGGRRPSAMAELRNLTRTVLS